MDDTKWAIPMARMEALTGMNVGFLYSLLLMTRKNS